MSFEEIANIDFSPFLISLKLSFVVTIILFLITFPIALKLSKTSSKAKPIFEAIFSLPIVLPPSVLGFYLLMSLSPNSFIGNFFKESFDISLVFSFEGLVIASCFYSFPFMLQPLQSGLESVNRNLIEASYTLGKSKLQTIIFVILPIIKPSILSAVVITFAHTMGEFGVVLMVGGNIPEVTSVASVAIYDSVENLDYFQAHIYSIILLILSFSVLFFIYYFNSKTKKAFK